MNTMKTKEEENNKLIAEFLGLEEETTVSNKRVYARREQSTIRLNDYKTEFYESNELKYHVSWDWLIDAFKNCGDIGGRYEYDTKERDKFEEIFNPDYSYFEIMDNDIEATHNRVVEFIKWYNENK